MKKIRNRTTRLVRVLALLSLLLALSGMAATASADEDIPPAPIKFSGYVWLNDGWAESGTIIDAYAGGKLISSHEVDQWSRYYVDIDSSELEEGETITFKVGEDAADKTAEWHASNLPTSQKLDLNIGGLPDSPPPEPPSTDGRSNGDDGTSGGYVPSTATPTGTGAQPVSGENVTSTTSTPTITGTLTPVATATSAEDSGAEPGKNKGLLPGFEAVFAIAGLLAVAYLFRRR